MAPPQDDGPARSVAAHAGEMYLTGAALMVAAMMLLPFNDAIAKHLSASYPVLQIVWFRFLFHFAILAPIVWSRYGWSALRPRRLGLQILRSGLTLLSVLLFFTAISTTPLADAMALLLCAPIMVTAVSPLLLGEHVGLHRWLAVFVGFLGAMIMLRPGFAAVQPGALLALLAGMSHALYNVLTRKLSGSAPPLVTLAYTAVLGVFGLALVVPFHWVTPAPADLLPMAAVGAIAAGGHFLLIRAFDYAPATVLAPFLYTELVAAAAIGYVWFNEFPDGWAWLGIAVIVASGIYISWRERLKKTT